MTFMSDLVVQSLTPIIEKGLLSGPGVRFEPYLFRSLGIYQTGAVLGRALRDRWETAANLFSEPGREAEVMQWLGGLANKRLTAVGAEPKTFFELFMSVELQTAGVSMDSFVRREGKKRLPVNEAAQIMQLKGLEGVGLGIHYPELVEKLWRQSYELIDKQTWAEARFHGLDIPEQPTIRRLAEEEQDCLSELKEWVSQNRPELLSPLGFLV